MTLTPYAEWSGSLRPSVCRTRYTERSRGVEINLLGVMVGVVIRK